MKVNYDERDLTAEDREIVTITVSTSRWALDAANRVLVRAADREWEAMRFAEGVALDDRESAEMRQSSAILAEHYRMLAIAAERVGMALIYGLLSDPVYRAQSNADFAARRDRQRDSRQHIYDIADARAEIEGTTTRG